MAEAGMDACRLNMSHATHHWVREVLETIRRVSAERGQPIAVGADLRGPKLRIGETAEGGLSLLAGETLFLEAGDFPARPDTVSVDYPYLAEDVRPGSLALLADGAIILRVEQVWQERLACRVEKGGVLTSRKGVNFPGIPLRLPALTEKDRQDMAFVASAGVDFLFLSYARSRQHLEAVRHALRSLGASLPLVAKIERQEGVDAMEEIIDAADGVCVARGDLGVEVPMGTLPTVQREAARRCLAAGKFAMMGGQVLASMVSSPIPLRAEVADVAAAVRDGLDAIVLSDETAAGAYPVEAVRLAAEVIASAEVEYGDNRPDPGFRQTAGRRHLGAAVVVSRDGRLVERLASLGLAGPLVAAVDSAQVANWLSTWWAVVPVLVEDLANREAAATRAVESALARGVPLPPGQLPLISDLDPAR